ncbi:MAG: GNAT family N-acetyltransferase [Akkermansiaceae bacterium]
MDKISPLMNNDINSDWQDVSPPADRRQLRDEVEALAAQDRGPLDSQGGLEVYLSPANAIPTVMHEIGRLRETCFREVGEGTGMSLDLDKYDDHYLHLFLWDPEKGNIAGGYRLGRTDTIMAEFGAEGLVTASYFQFEQPFLDYLTPGLELGRAFVATGYQKSLYPLALLWKGIGGFIARYPRYSRLFGCVSISDDYTKISQDIMVNYMRRSHRNSRLAPWVKPHSPYHELPDNQDISVHLQNIDQVSARISENEPDGKGVPVLLRQYLKLNATLLEFNVDAAFNHSLDALVLVDLRQAPARMLKRYLGQEGYQAVTS